MAAIVSAMVIFAIMAGIAAHRQNQVKACIHNLRTIISAKGAYAIATGLPENQSIDQSTVSTDLKGGWEGLRCPEGGVYSVGLTSGSNSSPGTREQSPACSVHGSAADLIANQPSEGTRPSTASFGGQKDDGKRS
jgi:hypothetical protein